MNNKHILLLFLSMYFSLYTVHLQAQVSIGSLQKPKAGALVDLNNDVKGGLLLPNVNIVDLEKIPAGFVGVASVKDIDYDLNGSIVYNTNATTGPGVFVWDGERWNMLTTPKNCATAEKPNVTASPLSVNTNANITLTAKLLSTNTNPSGFDYDIRWYKRKTGNDNWEIMSGKADNPVATIQESVAGTYEYYCTIAPKCDPCSPVASNIITVIVNCSGGAPAKPGVITLSSYIINPSAANPYIVAKVPSVAKATSYTWTLPEGLSGSSTVDSIIIWGKSPKTKLDTIYQIGAIQVTANNDCGSSMSATTSSPLKLYNCPGMIIVGGVYDKNTSPSIALKAGMTQTDLIGTGKPFSQNINKDLCVHQQEGLNMNSFDMGLPWSNAFTICTGLGLGLNKWRLPNAAELAQLSSGIPRWNRMTYYMVRNTGTCSASLEDFIIRGISNAKLSHWTNESNTAFDYDTSASSVKIFTTNESHNFRCVRTLNE